MAKHEQGNWPAYNVRAIAGNVERVFKCRNIDKLNGPAYKFIIGHMGFIAHYDINGFKSEYADLRDFAKKLQSGELTCDAGYNLKNADRHERDADFAKWYGPAYNKSKANAMRGIVAVVRQHTAEIEKDFTEREKTHDLALAGALIKKWE